MFGAQDIIDKCERITLDWNRLDPVSCIMDSIRYELQIEMGLTKDKIITETSLKIL